ncbi:hypothetical protein MFLAVUS_001902 [Mucor flavus]|uniref:Protection of telomeres protein 1 ssDNA-binding domain-containing protein n=1 Tax=Mucor flavus TaxID=439312 RepID=A0ABP9YNU2_9FUNG
MTSQKYLDLLKENRLNSLAYYSSGNHSKASCIYATIVSTQEIKHPTSSRADAMLTFYVSDPSIPMGSASVCLFEQDIGKLDFVKEADIIIIQDFNLKLFNGKRQISMNRFTKYATFVINPLNLTCNKNYEITPVDKNIISLLEQYLKECKESMTADSTIRLPSRRPLLETCEIDENESKFFDYIGEVTNVHMEDNRATLSLTDYTLNPLPIRSYVEENIVAKEYIINCTVWDSLVNECKDLQPGNYVSLRNCVKKDHNPLEFSIRCKDNENKVLLLKIEEDNPCLQKLIERKKSYTAPKSLKKISYDDYPLSTEIYKVPRKFTSIKDIKLEKKPRKFQTQARVINYEPKDVEKWIRGWCDKCFVSSAAGIPCRKCNENTKPIYSVSIFLKDHTDEEIRVEAFGKSAEDLFFEIPAGLVLTDETLKEKLRKLITLATEGNFFEFALHSVEYKNGLVYQFMRTRFIYEVNESSGSEADESAEEDELYDEEEDELDDEEEE